jgi:hypothetical protein
MLNLRMSFTTMETGRMAMAGMGFFWLMQLLLLGNSYIMSKDSWSALKMEALAFEIILFLLGLILGPQGRSFSLDPASGYLFAKQLYVTFCLRKSRSCKLLPWREHTKLHRRQEPSHLDTGTIQNLAGTYMD